MGGRYCVRLLGINFIEVVISFQAIDALLQLGVGTVIITSVQLKCHSSLLLLAKSRQGDFVGGFLTFSLGPLPLAGGILMLRGCV